jgi:hypothetical protein
MSRFGPYIYWYIGMGLYRYIDIDILYNSDVPADLTCITIIDTIIHKYTPYTAYTHIPHIHTYDAYYKAYNSYDI